MIWSLITAAVSYWLGKQEEEKKIIANSPGARAAAAAGASLSPTNAIKPNPNTDVNALPTGDVAPSRSTP